MVATVCNIKSSLLRNWSVVNLVSLNKPNTNIPTIKLRQLITRVKEIVSVKDEVNYKQLRIKTNGRGVELRDGKGFKGEAIKTKSQYRVRKGQLVVSKIDARNGAFGIVGKEEDGAIITSNFWSFSIDETFINPYYLLAVLVSEDYIKIYQSLSNGTTNRQYMNEELFLNLDIPLTEKQKQDVIGKDIRQTIKTINRKNSLIEINRSRMSTYISKYLDLEKEVKFQRKSFILLSSTKLARWDYPFLSNYCNVVSGTCNWARIGDLVNTLNTAEDGKSLRFDTKTTPQKEFRYIGLADVAKQTGELLGYETRKGEQVKSSSIVVPYGYILYGKLRPTLGKCVINTSHHTNIVCSTEFFVFKLEDSVNPEYIRYVLTSDVFTRQIENKCVGAIMPRLPLDVFLSTPIPMPSKEVQDEIAKTMKSMRKKISMETRKQETLEKLIPKIYKQ